jgi:hypothetical protein
VGIRCCVQETLGVDRLRGRPLARETTQTARTARSAEPRSTWAKMEARMKRITKALATGLTHAPSEMRILRIGCSFLKSRMTRKARNTRRKMNDSPPASPHSDTAITACAPRARRTGNESLSIN